MQFICNRIDIKVPPTDCGKHFIFNLILRFVIKANTRIIYLFIRTHNWF